METQNETNKDKDKDKDKDKEETDELLKNSLDADTDINDIRVITKFKGITFSNFKLTDVRKEMLNTLMAAKIESACYWAAELVCSAHYNELWDIIFFFFGKFIHISNPKIAIYLQLRLEQFQNIIRFGFTNDELRLRNNARIRYLFSEIVSILCTSKRKKHALENIKMKRQDIFDLTMFGDLLKAPNADFAKDIFKPDDPMEFFVAINELCFCLSPEGKNIIQTCFWIEWIFDFEQLCNKRMMSLQNKKIQCERRNQFPVENKFQMEIVWIIWEILFLQIKKNKNKNKNKLIKNNVPIIQIQTNKSTSTNDNIITETNNSLFLFIERTLTATMNLFCFRYSSACAKKRRFLLYFAVSLLCEPTAILAEAVKE